MAKELFIERLRDSRIYHNIKVSVAEAKAQLAKAIEAKEKLTALSQLADVYLSQKNYLAAYFLIDDYIDVPIMVHHRAYLLFRKGQISEILFEFNDALISYCRALASPTMPENIHYYLWNNMGFCWLYKQEFKNAEHCCRRAIELNPRQWNAWKNLGVSLEHQGRLQEAFEAYTRAAQLSQGRGVALLHLWRFNQRHPSYC